MSESITTQQQIDNCQTLLDVVIPHMEANPELVCFNRFSNVKGVPTCVYGWYIRLTVHEKEWLYLSDINEFFGTDYQHSHAIFGLKGEGPLAERKQRIIEHVEVLKGKL